MKIRWDDVRVFLELSRESSMQHAAKSMGVNVSTLSRRLKALETSLGHALFDRTPEGLVLTPAGADALEHAAALERTVHRFERSVASWEQDIAGIVRISTPPVLVRYAILPWLPEIARSYPKLSIEVRASTQVADILRREVDIALRMGRPQHQDLFAKRLTRYRHVIAASPALAERVGVLREIEQVSWIGWPEGHTLLTMSQWFHDANLPIQMRLDTFDGHLALARQGQGVVLCAEQLLEVNGLVEVELGEQLEQRLPALPESELWLVTHSELRHVPRVSLVWDQLLSQVTQHIQKHPAREP